MRRLDTTPLALALTVLLALVGCHRGVRTVPRRVRAVDAPGSEAPAVDRGCRSCHRAVYDAWARSQHAGAQRPLPRAGGMPTGLPDGRRALAEIGVAPLRQALVGAPGGRWQVADPAWDGAANVWFSVWGDAPPPPGAWGHAASRAMTWNAACAVCHVTDFDRAWDPRTDTYRSTWRASGVGCEACHGNDDAHVDGARHDARWRARPVDVCAACHARREELTGRFAPGERFDDHLRLTLADAPGAYHPDGRAADEDFEYVSLALSPMGARGVTCLDCHDPHSGALRVDNGRDGLCLGCHGAGLRGAPIIAAGHAHHRPDSVAARCVTCHMPEATYMQRDRRRDHGFTLPAPATAARTGSPDVCGACHRERDAAWSEAALVQWFGVGRRNARAARADAVAALRRGGGGVPAALRALAVEDNDAWRASLVGMLVPYVDDAAVRGAAMRALGDRSPWVRAAAARALEGVGDAQAAVAALRGDSVRAVRVEAAWSTRATLGADPRAQAEVRRWLDGTGDGPLGALRQAEMARLEGRPRDAAAWTARALRWDPSLSGAWASGPAPR